MTSRTPFDTHPGVVINRAKFNAPTFSSFGGVKTHTKLFYGILVGLAWSHLPQQRAKNDKDRPSLKDPFRNPQFV